jgi:hypothetical protein
MQVFGVLKTSSHQWTFDACALLDSALLKLRVGFMLKNTSGTFRTIKRARRRDEPEGLLRLRWVGAKTFGKDYGHVPFEAWSLNIMEKT